MSLPTINPDKPEFYIDVAALGRIDALPLTIGRLMEIERTEAKSSTSFMKKFIAVVGRNSDGEELTDEDVETLSDEDRDEFAEKVLGFNQYLFRENMQERRQDKEGHIVISFEGDDVKHPKEEGESHSDYLFCLLKLQREELKEQTRRILAPFDSIFKSTKQTFTPPFIEAFTKSRSATAQLGDMIDRMRIKIPSVFDVSETTSALNRLKARSSHPPEPSILDFSQMNNPVYNTNERLSDVVYRLDSMETVALQMAETVNSVSDAASRFLVDFGAATARAGRSSRRMMRIAAVAIVVAVLSTFIQVFYWERGIWRDRVDAAGAIDTISGHIMKNAEVQRESTERMGSELNTSNLAIKKSVDRLSTAIDGLSESVRIQKDVLNSSEFDGTFGRSK